MCNILETCPAPAQNSTSDSQSPNKINCSLGSRPRTYTSFRIGCFNEFPKSSIPLRLYFEGNTKIYDSCLMRILVYVLINVILDLQIEW